MTSDTLILWWLLAQRYSIALFQSRQSEEEIEWSEDIVVLPC